MTDFSLDPEGLTNIAKSLHSVSDSVVAQPGRLGSAPDCGMTSGHVQRALEQIQGELKGIGGEFDRLGDAVRQTRDLYLASDSRSNDRFQAVNGAWRVQP